MSTAVSPMLRWSSVRSCPRKAVYEATGAPARERTDKETRVLYRGRSIGRDWADFVAAKYGEDAIERERKVEWPLGIGHIDVFLKETKTAIEILSSAHASQDMIWSKMLQVVGYAEHDPDVENACLIVLDPSDFSEERFPIAKGTPTYDGLVDEMRSRIDQLLLWRDTGEIPARVCKKPADAFGMFCQHAEHCFEGWEPPPITEVQAVEARAKALELYNAKQKERVAKAAAKAEEDARKQIEQDIADTVPGLDRAGQWQVGPFKLTRTDVQRQPTLDVSKAEIAGLINTQALADYMKPGAAYSTWKIERITDDATFTADDFGDDPGW